MHTRPFHVANALRGFAVSPRDSSHAVLSGEAGQTVNEAAYAILCRSSARKVDGSRECHGAEKTGACFGPSDRVLPAESDRFMASRPKLAGPKAESSALASDGAFSMICTAVAAPMDARRSSHNCSCSATHPEVGSPTACKTSKMMKKASCTSRRLASRLTHSSAQRKSSTCLRYVSSIVLSTPYEHLLLLSMIAQASMSERSATPRWERCASLPTRDRNSRSTGARTVASGGGAATSSTPSSSSALDAARASPPRHALPPRASSRWR
mmetsp:Transcript_23526/g.71993  ORF Transcript_23526/g.71993 Transcript_23526/m.71993 type:complete len:268 (+) Transcript_23526:205-1008(+)|eukprot:scaffold160126_cov31-Tisochrysis_lutea.AAC.1